MTEQPTTPAPVPAALTPLRRELTELGGPNTLIWPTRDPHVVDLSSAHPGGVAMLLSGRDARLSDLVREPGALLRAQRAAGSLSEHVDAIAEEHGVHTCFLAMGTASWDIPGQEERPIAPILLRRAALRRLRPGPDFALDLADRVELNPALLTYLRGALHLDLRGDDLVALGRGDGPGFNPTPVYEALGERCADLPGLRITPRIVIGAFPYGKAEALADLSALAESGRLPRTDPLRALLTGRPLTAQREPVSTADTAVSDVTADQQAVLDRVAAGESLFVDAPPGTGAARLVAATIAAATTRGRSVLLLSEKAAPIRGVHAELERSGLSDLLLHVSDPAAEVDPSVITARWPARPPESEGHFTAPGRRAAEAARLLEGHTEATHTKREPWGVSIADAHDAMVTLGTRRPAPRSRVRLTGPVLEAIDPAARDAIVTQLTGVASRRAWRPGRQEQPWAGARLHTQDDVDDVLAAVERLRGSEGSLSRLRATLREVFADIAEPRAASPADYGRFLAGIEEISDTLEVFRPEIFDTPLDDLLAATAPAGTPAHGQPLGVFERLRLRHQAGKLLRPGRPPTDLHAALALAATQRRSWSRLTGGGGRPRIPTDIDRAHGAYERVYADLTHVGAVLADTPAGGHLLDTPWEELHRRLDDLAKDAAGARAVPEVIDDLDDLRARGLGDLIEDLAARRVEPAAVGDEVRFVWWASVLAEASRDERYGKVTGGRLDEALRTFVEADRASLGANAARIATRQREHFHRVGRGMRSVARQVAEAEAGRLPRPPWHAVVERWGGLLRAVAPAWAMTPFVVGQVLPLRERFDLVIVDDASRTTLARALSGIARGSQLLVIGDRGQLPPRVWSADGGVAPPAAPKQSLADLAAEVLPSQTLRESAYPRPRVAPRLGDSAAGEVVHPPTPREREDVRVVHVDGRGVLDERTGLVETTPSEVETVLTLVRAHLQQHPRHSLGIVTFGRRHADEITHAIAELLASDRSLAATAAALHEPLIAKPADRWQREQRDRTIVSVGFGRTPQGAVINRLGALSGPLGEQLVLLAATRARRAATWVTTFSPNDFKDKPDQAGHRALRTLLTSIEEGEATTESSAEELSPLLAGFVERLRASGLVVHTDVGEGDHRIDIAIADPRDSSRMLVAVDVDGPGYAGLASTRQRDRILVERLVDLGWHHLRLWTVEIFADPARQEAQVQRAVREAIEEDEQHG
ncbi:hypothetical protein O9K63_14595 [Janibacter cremeus]|uniref:DUF4011 domain-containing protein n=1 Tax=Janibacter cremeus TaxID=1285192 RepID=UPI0023F68861|nr:DUF4011 domain-containing protein [Janibacter cremeus]WEV77802.1 hypothetical protein O9K63_14595 [Janibacter cremeus]